MRGKDGVVRAFHNLCRHRGVARRRRQARAHCKNALVCPFHGWVYNLDGTLARRRPAGPFPDLDKTEFGLMPLDLEIWNGFIFVRFKAGPQPSVATLLTPFAGEARPLPHGRAWCRHRLLADDAREVNWKSVRDVDNEGYHVAMAHPALQDLYGRSYFDEPFVDGVSRSFATYNPACRAGAGACATTRRCCPRSSICRTVCIVVPGSITGCSPTPCSISRRRRCSFYQEFPIGIGQTLLRGAVYAAAGEDRRRRLSRYLAQRHRPRHRGGGRAADHLVERVDAVVSL